MAWCFKRWACCLMIGIFWLWSGSDNGQPKLISHVRGIWNCGDWWYIIGVRLNSYLCVIFSFHKSRGCQLERIELRFAIESIELINWLINSTDSINSPSRRAIKVEKCVNSIGFNCSSSNFDCYLIELNCYSIELDWYSIDFD